MKIVNKKWIFDNINSTVIISSYFAYDLKKKFIKKLLMKGLQ